PLLRTSLHSVSKNRFLTLFGMTACPNPATHPSPPGSRQRECAHPHEADGRTVNRLTIVELYGLSGNRSPRVGGSELPSPCLSDGLVGESPSGWSGSGSLVSGWCAPNAGSAS